MHIMKSIVINSTDYIHVLDNMVQSTVIVLNLIQAELWPFDFSLTWAVGLCRVVGASGVRWLV